MILSEAINKLFRDSINLILATPGYAIAAQQNAPRPSGAYGSVHLSSDTTLGWEQKTYSANVDPDPDLTETIEGLRQLSYTLAFFRDSAIDNSRAVRTGLIRQSIHDMFNATKVGLTTREQILEISEPLENGWEERSQFDVVVNIVGTDSDVVRAIETYDIAGQFQSRGLVYDFNIGV